MDHDKLQHFMFDRYICTPAPFGNSTQISKCHCVTALLSYYKCYFFFIPLRAFDEREKKYLMYNGTMERTGRNTEVPRSTG